MLRDDPRRGERCRGGDTIGIGPGRFAGGITIDRSVNLVGAAASATTISGGGPVLTIGSTTATPTVTLSDLTVTGGDTSSDPQAPRCGPDLTTCGPGYPAVTAPGGGIEAFAGSDVTIRDSGITGNTLTGSAGVTLAGAGICTVGFPTTFANSIVAFNRPDQCAGCDSVNPRGAGRSTR